MSDQVLLNQGDVLRQAMNLINMDPLPDDIFEQLDALEEQASEEDKEKFAWIYEGLAVAHPELLEKETTAAAPG